MTTVVAKRRNARLFQFSVLAACCRSPCPKRASFLFSEQRHGIVLGGSAASVELPQPLPQVPGRVALEHKGAPVHRHSIQELKVEALSFSRARSSSNDPPKEVECCVCGRHSQEWRPRLRILEQQPSDLPPVSVHEIVRQSFPNSTAAAVAGAVGKWETPEANAEAFSKAASSPSFP